MDMQETVSVILVTVQAGLEELPAGKARVGFLARKACLENLVPGRPETWQLVDAARLVADVFFARGRQDLREDIQAAMGGE